MKSTNKLIILALVFAVVSLTAYTAKQSTSKKVLMVEVIFGFDGNKDASGIYITQPDGNIEVINLIGYVGTDNIKKNAKIMGDYFRKVYADGWTLDNAAGGDNSKRYIFIK